MSESLHEAKVRFENSKVLFERAAIVYARDMNAYVAAALEGNKAERAERALVTTPAPGGGLPNSPGFTNDAAGEQNNG